MAESAPALTLCLCLTQARTPDVVVHAASCGFDAIYVDLEHGVTPLDTTSMLCTTAKLAGLMPFVRVPSADDTALMTRVIDGGASGVIIPHVETADVARRCVDVCCAPPVGRRSPYGLSGAAGAEVIVAPMIESRGAVEAASAIAGVDGVGLMLVGTHDLLSDLGTPGAFSDPAFLDALDAVAEACRSQGKRFGVAGVRDDALVARLVDRGLGFISAGTDAGFFQEAASARVDALRRIEKDGLP